jgi:DNA-binding transcriptional LysR family regulator
VDVAVVEGSHAELVGPLRDGEIDFMLGALRDTAMLDDLVQEAAFEDRPALVMRAGHPLADAVPARSGGAAALSVDIAWR